MTSQEIRDTIDLMTDSQHGWNEWQRLADNCVPGTTRPEVDACQMSELSREAEGKVQVLVRLAGYLTARGNGHSHEGACVYALKREKAVRKALGYTYP